MSVYKQVRKGWMKKLSKEQKKQFKAYVQDIADEMLKAYLLTNDVTCYMPIIDTNREMRITIKLDKEI